MARIRFSYVDGTVALMSIAPLSNMPTQRLVSRLLNDVRARLPDCRRSWWAIRRTVCLANQWITARADGTPAIVPAHTANAKRLADAIYDGSDEALHLTFRDGTTMTLDLAK